MIKTLSEACWVIEPNPSWVDDVEAHYTDEDQAARVLVAYLREIGNEDGQEEVDKVRARTTIVQKPHACRQIACDGCETLFEDEDEGVTHAVTDEDVNGLLRIAAACDWRRGERDGICCPSCVVPNPLPPGPGPDDVPLPLEGLGSA